ncbi:alpha/beta fold hydrolase [Marinobacter sp. SS13-12]|uniref:alpha/beta fold hydrolase n=1 Tax=Marinobacter sp. SS13-12 TaxID=3050451 RepID=UPI00255303C1|nr:alpha/beta fold hydrolase [Marinobacter sp. SS13-12]MDK8465209.1 alpha/beta fold hydrolase [Marinobacter sp. SS13-12]
MTHVEHDWDSPIWKHWLRELTREHTLARFDMRGSGLSDHGVAEQGVGVWIEDLEAVANALGWRRFPLLGICQGGPVAAAYAARHPERVSRLVLYNAYAHGAYTSDIPEFRTEEARALEGMIKVGWGKHHGAFREVFARLMSPPEARDQVAWWSELQRITTEPVTAVRLWHAFHAVDVRDQLGKIRAPALVVHIKGDQMVPFELGRELAAHISGAHFLPLEGKSHILQPDDPGWPTFVSEFRRFLTSQVSDHPEPPPEFECLTHRECAVLNEVAQGLSNDAIAERLAIAPKTARNHVTNICSKLNISTRSQLIVRAREAGFGSH